MDINFIQNICGLKPANFQKVVPTDSNYIFENDPSFQPLNLYDFFGRSATVNSFTECYYYVELGFEPVKTTIFDIGLIFLQIFVFGLILFRFMKSNIYKRILKKMKLITTKSGFISFTKDKQTINSLFVVFLLIQGYFLFDFVRTKSVRIPRFIDEYINLTSSVNFFTSLNFDAGEFIGGNFSVALTSGPISAVGSSIAWILTDKLTIARISNYFWVCLIQLILSFILLKFYNSEFKFLILTSFLFIILIPYWQGPLYSLGEVSSAVIFINAVFLFPKFRNLSLFLFSISIFYGKLLNLVLFVGFYIPVIIYEKKLKYILKDSLVFSLPLIAWLTIVNFKYSGGNAINYLTDQFDFVLNHQSSGVKSQSANFILNYIETISATEFGGWNNFEKFRLIFIPLLFVYLIIRNKDNIDSLFGKISTPLIFSLTFIYLWFWLLNDTKWIRHTNHFTVLIIVSLLYFINFEIFKSNLDFLFSVFLLGVFIQNNKYLIVMIILLSVFVVARYEQKKYNFIKFLIVGIIFLDITIPYFEKDTFGNLHHIIDSCMIELKSPECLSSYLNR